MKKIIFYLLMIVLPVAIWAGIELIANAFTHRFDPLRVDSEKNTLYVNQDYFDDFFLTEQTSLFTTSLSNRAIHRDKGDRMRIFCLGASTTAGYPYNTFADFDAPSSFPNYLRAILQFNRDIPDIDLMNLGCNSLNSLCVLELFKDLVPYDPDIVIVYSGHNEFYGPNEFSAPRDKVQLYTHQNLYRFLIDIRRTYLYQGLRKVIRIFDKDFDKEKPVASPVLWSENNAIHYTDPLNDTVKLNYENNIRKMAKLAKENGIHLVLCTPVSNWTFPPFISLHDPRFSLTQKVQFDSLDNHARSLYSNQQFEKALAIWDRLWHMDSTYASLYYHTGMAMTQLGDYPSAAQQLFFAKETDALPFRARAFVPNIIRQIANTEHVILADVEQFYVSLSKRFIPLNMQLLDHVHPTDEGYFSVAMMLAQTLYDSHLFPKVDKLEFPTFDETQIALGIDPIVLRKIEMEFAQNGYIQIISSLNPQIQSFLMRLYTQANVEADRIGRERVRQDMKESESEPES